jgi:hypothetical protein
MRISFFALWQEFLDKKYIFLIHTPAENRQKKAILTCALLSGIIF